MVTNPCCCDLQCGVRAIGIVYIVAASVRLIIWIFVLAVGDEVYKETYELTSVHRNVFYVYVIVQIVVNLIDLGLSIPILVGANSKSIGALRVWYVRVVFFCNDIYGICLAPYFPTSYISFVIWIVLFIYFTVCIQCFINQIQQEKAGFPMGQVPGFAPVVPYGYPPPSPAYSMVQPPPPYYAQTNQTQQPLQGYQQPQKFAAPQQQQFAAPQPQKFATPQP